MSKPFQPESATHLYRSTHRSTKATGANRPNVIYMRSPPPPVTALKHQSVPISAACSINRLVVTPWVSVLSASNIIFRTIITPPYQSPRKITRRS